MNKFLEGSKLSSSLKRKRNNLTQKTPSFNHTQITQKKDKFQSRIFTKTLSNHSAVT